MDNINRKNEASERVWDTMQNEVNEAYEETYGAYMSAGYHEMDARSHGFNSAKTIKKYYDDNFDELVRDELKNDNTATKDLIDFTEWNEPAAVAVEVKYYNGPCVEAYICE